jgi:hypothetical protein
MSQPHQPGNGFPQQQPGAPTYGRQPQWAAQQVQPGPYGPGPAPYQPPPPPKKGMPAWGIVLITLGGIFVFVVFIGVLVGGDDSGNQTRKPTIAEAPRKEPAKKEPVAKGDGKADAKPADKPAEPAPVQIAAKKTAFRPGILHDGGDFTSVQVTITNNSDKKIDVNPLYFSITDTDGFKRNAELAEDENQMDVMDLAPGEKTTGVITGKGAFTPKYVTYTDGLFGDDVRGNVS